MAAALTCQGYSENGSSNKLGSMLLGTPTPTTHMLAPVVRSALSPSLPRLPRAAAICGCGKLRQAAAGCGRLQQAAAGCGPGTRGLAMVLNHREINSRAHQAIQNGGIRTGCLEHPKHFVPLWLCLKTHV